MWSDGGGGDWHGDGSGLCGSGEWREVVVVVLLNRHRGPQEYCFRCGFLWKEERVRLLISSLGPSSTPSYSPRPSTPPSYSPGPSTPQSYFPGPSRNADCSNCKLLLGNIMVLKATVEMYMHLEQYILTSAALLHEVYNDMWENLVWSSLSFGILDKITLDVDFFMERGTSPSTDQFSWSFIDSKLFSRTFITSKLFSMSFNTSKLLFRTFKKCRALKHLGKIALDVDFLWKEERVRLLTSSLGASLTPSYSP
uniref:Uncharacterized protein n=1 Tax=Tanacetum cinerariifolium TaxID=118510 RepID=A0A6L2NYF6_TANCI|nr:hypothetical protein [Tanacetum cinerariifolium]